MNTYCEYLIVTTSDLDNCLSLARNAKQILLFSVLTLLGDKFLESWLKSLEELNGES